MKKAEFKKNLNIIIRFSIIDLKRPFKSSVLSWFWLIIQPLLMILMYFFAFSASGNNIDYLILKRDSNLFYIGEYNFIYHRTSWLIIGVLTWNYIGMVISLGPLSIKQYSWLITSLGKPLYLPPIIVNFSKGYIGIISIIISWIIYIIIAATNINVPIDNSNNIINGPIINLKILQLPLIIIFIFLFMTLWSCALAPFSSFSKDLMNIIGIMPLFLSWITGVFLENANPDSALGIIMRLNPFNFLIENLRGSIMGFQWFYQDIISFISFITFIVILFVLSYFSMKKSKKLVVDLI